MKIQAQVGAIVLMMAATATLGNISANMEQECPIIISTADVQFTQLLSLGNSAVAEAQQAEALGDDAEVERLHRVYLEVQADIVALQVKIEPCHVWANEEFRAIQETPIATPELTEAYNSLHP